MRGADRRPGAASSRHTCGVRTADVVLSRLPWRVRWSLRLRGRRPCIYVVAHFGLRIASTIPVFFVDVDGRRFGRHLNPAVIGFRGAIDGRATGPLFGHVAPGSHRLVIDDGAGSEWASDFCLTASESLVVVVRGRRKEKFWKDTLTIQCVVADRSGRVLRQVD